MRHGILSDNLILRLEDRWETDGANNLKKTIASATSDLKVRYVVLIQYTFCQIQLIFPLGLLVVVGGVCVCTKKVFAHSPGSANWEKSKSHGSNHTAKQQIYEFSE